MVTIYKLVDPRDLFSIPQYVGKSKDAKTRLKWHINKPHSPRIRKWVKELKKSGIKPILIPLRTVPENEWEFAEIEEIYKAREINPNLLNIADGGVADGPPHDLAVRLGRHMAKV